ncbi:MAG TPA: pteridine reductase, partial [Gammaproteobacteria bacterium]|nr:pteridine reductase [Gammaproteobacteria bacterium]
MSQTKVALVTGSARRIGAQTIRQLHASGLNVIVHYRRSGKEAQALIDDLNTERPDSARGLQGDLLETGAAPELIQQAITFWGRLDVLVNNASAFYPTEIGHITEKDWDILVGSNMKAPLFLAQAAADELKHNHGCIVNMVDIHADRPLKNYTVYSIAKAGLVTLTKSLARELGPEVRVNGVAPGAILWPETPNEEEEHQEIIKRTALKREGNPDDIARTIRFLV